MHNEYFLPYGGFEWLENIDKINVMSINECNSSEKSAVEYFSEVDLEYPEKLHELHNDFPLAPEKFTVSSDMLSKYCKNIANKYEIKVGDVKKLISNLVNKTTYSQTCA